MAGHSKAPSNLGRLLRVAKGRKRAAVLTHDNPDPDSLASAWALSVLLEKRARVPSTIVYGGIIGRSENIAFVRSLKVPIVAASAVDFDSFDLLALVDTQENVGNHALPPNKRAHIIIDHHPLRDDAPPAAFADVGRAFGATSTLLTEYLKEAHIDPGPELATALYYGIKADTRDLARQTNDPDVAAYLWLFPRIDRDALRHIEHPSVPARYFRLYHEAIARARVFPGGVMADLGEVYSPDMVAEVAERLSFLDECKWSLAVGAYGRQLYLSLRLSDRRINAGRLVRELCASMGGSAGGHGSMAGARIPLPRETKARARLKQEVFRRFRKGFGVEGTRGLSLLSDDV